MRGHEIDLFAMRPAAKIAGDVLQFFFLLIVGKPVGKIMQARSVAVYVPPAVTKLFQIFSEGKRRKVSGGGASGQRQHGFHKGCAVKGMKINHQLFPARHLQGACLIGRAQEKTADFQNQIPRETILPARFLFQVAGFRSVKIGRHHVVSL